MKKFKFENKKQNNYFEGWYFKCTYTNAGLELMYDL